MSTDTITEAPAEAEATMPRTADQIVTAMRKQRAGFELMFGETPADLITDAAAAAQEYRDNFGPDVDDLTLLRGLNYTAALLSELYVECPALDVISQMMTTNMITLSLAGEFSG